jgi:hypothetical protein
MISSRGFDCFKPSIIGLLSEILSAFLEKASILLGTISGISTYDRCDAAHPAEPARLGSPAEPGCTERQSIAG